MSRFTLKRYEPWSLVDEFARLLENANDRESCGSTCHWSPSFDISKDNDGYHLHGDLPGLDRNQVKINLLEEGNVLEISGERVEGKECQDHGYFRRERSMEVFTADFHCLTKSTWNALPRRWTEAFWRFFCP